MFQRPSEPDLCREIQILAHGLNSNARVGLRQASRIESDAADAVAPVPQLDGPSLPVPPFAE